MKNNEFIPEEQNQGLNLMLSILKNDWVAQKKIFLVMIAIAAMSAIFLKVSGMWDSISFLITIFGIEAPLFLYILADRSLAIDNEEGALGFLSRLPMSKLAIIFFKEFSLIIFAFALYFIFGFIALFSGCDLVLLLNASYNNPGLLLIPLFAIHYGVFTSMFPRGTGFIASAIIVIATLCFFNDLDSIANANYFLLLLLSVSVLYSTSSFLFSKFDGKKLQVSANKAIISQLIGMVVIAVLWNLISLYADRNINIDFSKGGSWIPTDNGKQIIWNLCSKSDSLFDTISKKSEYYYSKPEDVWKALERSFEKTKSEKRLFIQNLEKESVTPIASRYSQLPIMSGNESNIDYNSFVEAYVEKIEFGISKGTNQSVISKEGKIIKTISPVFGNSEGAFRAINDKSFLYREDIGTKENYTSEYFVYNTEKGSRKILSLSKEDSFRGWVVTPKKSDGSQKIFMLAAMNGKAKNLFMVSAENQEKTPLPLTKNASLKAVGNDFMIFDDGIWNSQMVKEEKNILVKYDGAYEELLWLGDNAKVIGISSSGKIIAALPFNGGRDKRRQAFIAIVEADPETKTVKDIYRPGFSFLKLIALSDDGNYAFIHTFNQEKREGTYTFAMNMSSGEIVNFSELNQGANKGGLSIHNGPFKLSGSKFMVGGSLKGENYNGIIELDAKNGSIKRTVSYNKVSDLIRQGAW